MDPSDAEYLARSVIDPSAFAFIYDRHFNACTATSIAGWDVTSLTNSPRRLSLLLLLDGRRAARAKACSRGSTASQPISFGVTVERSRVNCVRTVAAESDNWIAYDASETPPDGDPLDARLAGALAAMRPRERDALLLYALADLSYEEIAVALAVPLGTVRTWLHRARETARSELSRDEMSVSTLATTGVDLDG